MSYSHKIPPKVVGELETEFADYPLLSLATNCDLTLQRYTGARNHGIPSHRQRCASLQGRIRRKELSSGTLGELKGEREDLYFGKLETIHFIRSELNLSI